MSALSLGATTCQHKSRTSQSLLCTDYTVVHSSIKNRVPLFPWNQHTATSLHAFCTHLGARRDVQDSQHIAHISCTHTWRESSNYLADASPDQLECSNNRYCSSQCTTRMSLTLYTGTQYLPLQLGAASRYRRKHDDAALEISTMQ